MNWKRFFQQDCQSSIIVFVSVLTNMMILRLRFNIDILAHPKTLIKGKNNIVTKKRLKIGLTSAGFIHPQDITFLNIRGKLISEGGCTIGRGCRIDIGPNGIVKIGSGSALNVKSTFIIMNKLFIGSDCEISWNCQFLDEDFHDINYENKRKQTSQGIIIGDHVWIGCGVYIYKNTVIPNGCVVASNSVVKGVFMKENVLIAGNPAREIKENIKWN